MMLGKKVKVRQKVWVDRPIPKRKGPSAEEGQPARGFLLYNQPDCSIQHPNDLGFLITRLTAIRITEGLARIGAWAVGGLV